MVELLLSKSYNFNILEKKENADFEATTFLPFLCHKSATTDQIGLNRSLNCKLQHILATVPRKLVQLCHSGHATGGTPSWIQSVFYAIRLAKRWHEQDMLIETVDLSEAGGASTPNNLLKFVAFC